MAGPLLEARGLYMASRIGHAVYFFNDFVAHFMVCSTITSQSQLSEFPFAE